MYDSELILGLWNHCNNRCSFCYHQTFYDLPVDLFHHLEVCNDILNSSFMENFTRLRFLGGELFDGAIDSLKARAAYNKILDSTLSLLQSGQLKKLNLLTNMIYEDRKDLAETLNFFDTNGVIDKIELSTSYDFEGRFLRKNSEKWWWDNINWALATYPNISIDVGIIMTQPFITKVTKEWLDDFHKKTQYRCNIRLNELDTAIIETTKYNSPFSHLFPVRSDFLKFLKKLKDWGYYDIIGVAPGGINPWNKVLSMQYICTHKFSFPVYKNLSYIIPERKVFREDGYIDSDIPLFDDIQKILNL